MDAIVDAMIHCFPQIGLDDREQPDVSGLRKMSSMLAPFLQAMVEGGEYDELDYGMVLDICQVFPCDLAKHLDRKQFGICYLVTSQVTPEERLKLLDTYDQPKDYSYFLSPEERRAMCVNSVQLSRVFEEECNRCQIPCFETSQNREEQFSFLLEHLKKWGDFPPAGESQENSLPLL